MPYKNHFWFPKETVNEQSLKQLNIYYYIQKYIFKIYIFLNLKNLFFQCKVQWKVSMDVLNWTIDASKETLLFFF